MESDAAEYDEAIARAVGGDENAFGVVVAPHERPLFRHCYRMLGSGPDAEDALQDTLVRAWRRLDTYDAAGAFGGWLYRIATNVCLDALRSRQNRVDPVTLGPPSNPEMAPGAPDAEIEWVEPIASPSPSADPQDEIVGREDITPSRSSQPCSGCHRASERVCCFTTSSASPSRRWPRPSR